MPYAHDADKLKVWETDRAAAIAKDPADWNTYDPQVQMIVQTYNSFLASKGSFQKLDWQWVKALLWVESGATSPEWTVKPMQIGVPHDPGLTGLLTTNAGKLILPPEYSKALTFSTVTSNPVLNIAAGTGYLLQRLASFGMVADPVATAKPAPSTLLDAAHSGSLAGVPGAAQSTPTTSPVSGPPSRQHPAHSHSHGGKAAKTKHHAPHKTTHQAITGWRPVSANMIARRYNGGGDGNYSGKLQFCYDIVRGQSDPGNPFPKPDVKAGKK